MQAGQSSSDTLDELNEKQVFLELRRVVLCKCNTVDLSTDSQMEKSKHRLTTLLYNQQRWKQLLIGVIRDLNEERNADAYTTG
jgi:hypothetical protein